MALIYEYEAIWCAQIQPQGASFNAIELIFRWYEAIRRLGLDVDIVRPGVSLAGYRLVLVPFLPIISDATETALAEAKGLTVFGPRAGSKTRDFAIPPNLPPGPLASLLGLRVIEVSSMRAGVSASFSGVISGKAERWREHIEASEGVIARFDDGDPAAVSKGNRIYAGFWPDAQALASIMAYAVRGAGLATLPLPEHIRIRRRGDLLFVFNYGSQSWHAPAFDGETLLGGRDVPAHGYWVLRQKQQG